MSVSIIVLKVIAPSTDRSHVRCLRSTSPPRARPLSLCLLVLVSCLARGLAARRAVARSVVEDDGVGEALGVALLDGALARDLHVDLVALGGEVGLRLDEGVGSRPSPSRTAMSMLAPMRPATSVFCATKRDLICTSSSLCRAWRKRPTARALRRRADHRLHNLQVVREGRDDVMRFRMLDELLRLVDGVERLVEDGLWVRDDEPKVTTSPRA